MKCSRCGYEIEEGQKFCGNCGAKVQEESISNNKPIDSAFEEPKQVKKKVPIKIISYIVWVILCVAASIDTNKNNDTYEWVIPLIFCIIIPLIINQIVKSSKAKKEKRKQAALEDPNVVLKHIAGLPIADNMECKLILRSDKIEFESSGYKFNLEKSKLTDVSIKTDVEIQKQVSSSVGGAVGGAVLFGPLGAMIGGRAKERTSTVSKQYLIFTYTKDEEIKYISFEINPIYYLKTAQKFVDDFKAIKTKVNSVDL